MTPHHRTVSAILWAGMLCGIARNSPADALPPAAVQSFRFPAAMARGLESDLLAPADSASTLRFERGHVAIGVLPVPRPEHRRRFLPQQDTFRLPPGGLPHARLLLTGVVDGNGGVVSNHGNQLAIDVAIGSANAADATQTVAIPFDVESGSAFLDVPLPIPFATEGPTRVEVRGVKVNDPIGQTFAVLGFQVEPAPPATPTPQTTPTPGGTPPRVGYCYVGPSCRGPSFPSDQARCCRLSTTNSLPSFVTSWCPPEQFDSQTGQCSACVPCAAATPVTCDARDTCGGDCAAACADGRRAAGVCTTNNGQCACAANCSEPTPTIGLPHGHICCECQTPLAACLEFDFIEVERSCPLGCTTVLNGHCDPGTKGCRPPTTCATDEDCRDGNPCTIDRCTPAGCEHDCVCLGPSACGPGPTAERR